MAPPFQESCHRRRHAWFENGHWLDGENWKRTGAEHARIYPWNTLLDLMQMSEFPMVDVLRLRALPDHRLWVRFTDGSEGVRDLSELIAQGGPMVEPLRSPDYFVRVFVEMGAPTWPNGFDLDPINLYMQMRDAGELTQVAAE
jgi:hypothetical protein